MVHTENFVLVDAKKRVRGFWNQKGGYCRLIEDINFLTNE
jgi:protein SCO1/2